jgi:hypothetical protein
MASKARSGSDLVQTITANTSAPANTINIAANGQISVNNNIIPSTNITYDLGTNLLRWRDLYLSGQTIQLGNTTISTTGNNLVLPTNTVLGVGGNSLSADVSVDGGSATSTYTAAQSIDGGSASG